MQQQKKSVTARIPQDLYDKCNQQYDNMTDAIIEGLELLCNTDRKTGVISVELLHEEKDKKITELQSQIETLEENLRNKEPNNLQVYEARLEEKEFRITDLQSYNESLKKELEDNKQMHNNYMLQMQTIINQRAIEAPGAKKKRFWEIWK
jgi:hypothetical protein